MMLSSALSARMIPFAEAREAIQADAAYTRRINDLQGRTNTAARALAAALEEVRCRATRPRALAKFETLQNAINARVARAKRAAHLRHWAA